MRRLYAGLLLLVHVLLFGTLGYETIEGWNLLDSFYMAVTTLTTVGYSEVHHLSDYGRIFTILFIIAGVLVVAVNVAAFTRFLVEGEIRDFMEKKRAKKGIDRLTNHYIICGYGRIGTVIADELSAHKVPFVVVDSSPEKSEEISRKGYPAVHGDSVDEEVMLAAGADRVVSPYSIGGRRMANIILRPAVVEFLDLTVGKGDLELAIEELRVRRGSPLIGKTIVDSEIRTKFGSIIVAIARPNEKMVFNPPPRTVILEDDVLIALGRMQDLKALFAAVTKAHGKTA